jgi:hypothetical protein
MKNQGLEGNTDKIYKRIYIQNISRNPYSSIKGKKGLKAWQIVCEALS